MTSSKPFFQISPQSLSVFVNNLPPNIHWRWVKQIFQHHGNVTEVFISQRRSWSGKNFGFVRISNLEDAKNAVEKLNGAWFLDYRMEVHFAKNKGSSAYWRKVESKNEKHYTDAFTTGYNQRESRKEQESTEGDNLDLIEVETTNQDLKWLETSVIASSKSPLNIQILHLILNTKGFYPVSIATMGGSWVLIQLENKASMMKLLTDGNKWKDEYFYWIKPWSKDLISNEKLVWLKISDLPLHAWSDDVLKQIGDYWGRYIQADECFYKIQRLDSTRILIVLNKNIVVKNLFVLKVNGVKYSIKLEVEDYFDFGWKQHSSTSLEGSIRPDPVYEKPPVTVEETQLEDNDVEEDQNLPVEETSNSHQSTIEPPLEKEATAFEAISQQINDELAGIVNREDEIGGNFKSNLVEEFLNAETTVLGFELVIPNPMRANYPASDPENLSLIVQKSPDKSVQPTVKSHEENEAIAGETQEVREDAAGNITRYKKFVSVSSLQSEGVNCGKKKSASTKRKSKKVNKKVSYSRKKENNMLGYYSEATSLNDEEITDDDIRNRNRALRKEAQATLEVARLLGLSTTADEEDIIRNLMEAEIEEMAREICRE